MARTETPAPETERLALRRLTGDDAPFILALLNEPSFIQFIGDKGVRTLEDAGAYLAKGPLASYESRGFGLYMVERKEDGRPLGICGLVKRDGLEDVDVGFAFLPEAWGKGYAREATRAVLDEGRVTFGLPRVVAITTKDNQRSIRVLEALGLSFAGLIRLTPEAEELNLFTTGDWSQEG